MFSSNENSLPKLQLEYYQKARTDMLRYLNLRMGLFKGLSKLNRYKSPNFFVQIEYSPSELPKIRYYLDKILRRRGGFIPIVLDRREEILKHKIEGKYYSASQFSKSYTSNFNKNQYNSLYEQLRNNKNGIIFHNDPNLKELEILYKLADPIHYTEKEFSSYDEPHHNYYSRMLKLNKRKVQLLAGELPISIYNEMKKILITGHIDAIKIIGKTIYICDYKPDFEINLDNPDQVQTPFADSIPQIGAYGLIFKEMFKNILEKYGYEIRCYTYNYKNGGLSWDPEKGLAAYTAFYETYKPEKGSPPWRFLVSNDLVDLYKEIYE